jgi:hypothetical protein
MSIMSLSTIIPISIAGFGTREATLEPFFPITLFRRKLPSPSPSCTFQPFSSGADSSGWYSGW